MHILPIESHKNAWSVCSENNMIPIRKLQLFTRQLRDLLPLLVLLALFSTHHYGNQTNGEQKH